MAAEVDGTLVGTGRNADVYDIGGGRVLRRYRDGREERSVETEAQVMAHARARGVPVPEVFIRYRLTDHNLLPAEAARLKRLPPAARAPEASA